VNCPNCGELMAHEKQLKRVAINTRTGHELLAYRSRSRCPSCDFATPLTGGDFALPNGYIRIPPRRPI